MPRTSKSEWQLWYQDTFDRASPRQVEVAGSGLERGLRALWSRHLRETVRADGGRGFSHFNLWWRPAGQSVEIVGPWPGSVRLRRWIVDEAAAGLLNKVVRVHAKLIRAGQTSAAILRAAEQAASQTDFVAWLE